MNNYPSESGQAVHTSPDSRVPNGGTHKPAKDKGLPGQKTGAGKGQTTTLRSAKQGETFLITEVGGEGALRQHFLDMGVIPGTRVTVMQFAPMGDPMEIQIHGYELTLRVADAEKIQVREITEKRKKETVSLNYEQQELFQFDNDHL